MVRWWVVVFIASWASVASAQAVAPKPAKASAGKTAKRPAKSAKPPLPLVAGSKPLHLGLHGLSLKRHHLEWHLESVPVPGLDSRANASGLRALAVVGSPADEQRVEFGLAPLVPLKLPSSPVTGQDGVEAARQPKKSLVPVPQIYMRYSW